MKSTVVRKGATASIILGFGALLTACGGGGGGSSVSATPATITGYTTDGPFSANVYVYNSSGSLCGETVSSSQDGSFTVSLSSSCSSGPYLIEAIATSGSDAGTYYYVVDKNLNGIYVTPNSDALIRIESASLGGVSLTAFVNNPSAFANMEDQEIQYSHSGLSFTQVFFPYSLTVTGTMRTHSSVSNISYTIGGLEKLIYPSNTALILARDLSYGSYGAGMMTQATFAGSITNNVLSLTRPYGTESITFSGDLNNPSSLSVLGLSYSFNSGSETGYEVITSGTGTASITNTVNGNTYSLTITTANPMATATSYTISNNSNTTTITCGGISIQVSNSIMPINGVPELESSMSGMMGGVNIPSPISYTSGMMGGASTLPIPYAPGSMGGTSTTLPISGAPGSMGGTSTTLPISSSR